MPCMFVRGLVPVFAACLAAALVTPAKALEPGLDGGGGYEHLELPSTRFSHKFDQVTGATPKIVDHDGDLDGTRVDASLAGRGNFGGVPIIAGIAGYYGSHDGRQTSTCISGVSDLCARISYVDPDPLALNTVLFAPGSRVVTVTTVDTTTWGIILQAQTDTAASQNGAKLDLKGGAGYRRIDTDLALNQTRLSGGSGAPVPGSLREAYDTGYLGSFIGVVGKLPVGYGIDLKVDGDVGIYWARTDFDGVYVTTGSAFAWQNYRQAYAMERDEAAIIASLKISLDKDFGPVKVGVFARGEYYSYAPEIQYLDSAGNDVTAIKDGDAWAASAGGQLIVPFN